MQVILGLGLSFLHRPILFFYIVTIILGLGLSFLHRPILFFYIVTIIIYFKVCYANKIIKSTAFINPNSTVTT